MDSWRLIDVGTVDGPTSASMFEAVSMCCSSKDSPNTIIFWRINPPCVYVGYHQLVLEEVNLENCRKLGVQVVRRVLGGGCVYCDKNQLLYSVIMNIKDSRIPCKMEEAYRVILKGVVLAFKKLGLKKVFYEKKLNAILVDGKKISGNAGLMDGEVTMVNGSFLLNFDYERMCKVLLHPLKNLPGNPKKPQEGLTNLKRELGRRITFSEAKKVLKEGFEEALNIRLVKDKFTIKESRLILKLKQKHLSKNWIFLMDLKHTNLRMEKLWTVFPWICF